MALLGALVWRVLLAVLPGAGFPPRRAASAMAALAALLLFAPPRSAAADLPGPELLGELRARLLEKPACHPECAASPRLRLEVEPSALQLRLEIDAAAPTAVPLPGSARDWVPEQVIVDGAPATALRRDEAGVLWLQVDAGAHQVLVAGALPDRDTIELPLPLKPHRVEASSRGWSVQGIGKDGLPEDNLQLTRLREAGAGARPALEPSALPAFASITRTLRLGLTWQVETLVTRLTPADSTLVLEVPLLAGESVTSAGVRVENGRAFVSFGPGAVQTSWISALDVAASLELHAPDAVAWTETWVLDAGPLWHVEVEGIPVIHQEASGVRLREWRPWPGERVAVRVTRPEGVEGPTLTLDGSQLAISPGLRATRASLELRLRSSQGGQHAIQLPEGAVLERVTIDGSEQPIRQEGREVVLPLTPGTHALGVAWQEPRGIATRFDSPEVDLRAPSVNADVTLSLPADRWLLWASGPRLGPSVLFWPLLAVLAAVAIGLGRIRNTPLRSSALVALGNRPHAGAAGRGRRRRRLAARARLARRARHGGARALVRSRAAGARDLDVRGARRAPLLDPAGSARAPGDAGGWPRLERARAALVPGPGRSEPAPAVGALDPAARLPRRDARLVALARDGALALAALGLGPVQPRRSLARAPARHRRLIGSSA